MEYQCRAQYQAQNTEHKGRREDTLLAQFYSTSVSFTTIKQSVWGKVLTSRCLESQGLLPVISPSPAEMVVFAMNEDLRPQAVQAADEC